MATSEDCKPRELLLAPQTTTVEFYVKSPVGTRRSFAIMKRTRSGIESKTVVIESDAVDSVNTHLKAGTLALDEAREAVGREVLRLRKMHGTSKKVTLSPANIRTLKRYWDAEYEHRDNVDQRSAWARLRRAVESLGDVPLTAMALR